MSIWCGPRSDGGVIRPLSIAGAAGAATGVTALLPAVASAHSITGRIDSPLPFVAYLAAAAIAVAGSFVIIAAGDPGPPRIGPPGRERIVPRWLRLGLRAAGLLGWLWIAAQAVAGGSSDADVASLFLWVYGWVGLALLSAFLGPVWSWLDPFTTIYDILAAAGRGLGLSGTVAQPWPTRLGMWIAVVGLAFFIWLELVARVLQGRSLGLVLLGYTAITLLGMAQYGRDPWRRQAEVFSVWFGILGRMAPIALSGTPEDGRVVVRPYATGLITSRWSREAVVMVALGTGSIIYDGLSQTRQFFELFGFPSVPAGTVILGVFLGCLVALVMLVALGVGRSYRGVGLGPMGAGLLPVALGYLIAHYLTFLLADGQRLLVAISDPFQQGWDLFGTAFFEPSLTWVPTSALWGLQVGAVVIGHIVGAWAGHARARFDVAARSGSDGSAADSRSAAGSRAGARSGSSAGSGSSARAQLPLAFLMVGLTTLTLWSLGQNLVFEDSVEHTMSMADATEPSGAADPGV